MTEEEHKICSLAEKCLKEGFQLYDARHRVFAKQHDNSISVGYRTSNKNINQETTQFDIQISGNICYNLFTEIAKEFRGKGFGKKLYRVVENIARGSGCDRVRMTASGWTPSGESREKYMLRLGYHKIETGEVEKLLD